MNIVINRHKYTYDMGVGELVERIECALPFIPRQGELITVHPGKEPSEESWTGKVTGIQHVIAGPRCLSSTILTVCDGYNSHRQS